MKRCLLITLPAVLLSCGQESGDSQPGGDSVAPAVDARTPSPDSEAAGQEAGPHQDAAPPVADAAPPVVDAGPPPDTFKTPDKQIPDTLAPDTKPPCDPALQGTYTAPFSLTAAEMVGSIVVNKMACSGTLTAKASCAQVPVLKGSYTCNYSGGLVAFDNKQTGTIEGDVAPGGTFTGTITHAYESSLKKTYSVTGTLGGGKIAGSGKGSLLPNPMSAVPWKVTFSFQGT